MMLRYLRLGAVYMWLQIRRRFIYKASFVMQFFAQGLNYAVTFLLMWVMISAFDNMNGWNAYEVMLLYAVNLTAYGFAGMFFYFVRYNVLKDIKSGAFDDILTKPVSTLPFLVIQNQTPAYIIHLSLAVIMLVVCITKIGIEMSLLTVLNLLFIVVCGTLILGGMFLFITAPAFLITDASNLGSILFFLRESSYYPLSIFPRFLQVIMTFVLPFGMINYFPLQPLLGKSDYLFLGPNIAYLAPLFTAVFYALAVCCFNFCAKQYKSTGS